jgi:uridine kinase
LIISLKIFVLLATGAAALMAIRVLLDHNVSEDKIALLSLLVSKQGLSK